mmetsp:Transcript_33155/g.73143  ORF Transcript_33155/g.73143 Transcript_33155/m.73143 type:complete len:513 (+) Transcript_33155:122-1660(+)|eukprot:CAMPEP_0178658496 /NCGR_PEP_ID=MMETSP0698-20121128/26020_1 /TAXON_ID=265572 /ORGANISM="Extubocellulus spinifer, Strain CCMP396" /LENGTH=512 /DNA_ID=CAMNT_0020300885 /DNA_START=174 /DNA_END=1712 /DNA_ORIENTATION=+
MPSSSASTEEAYLAEDANSTREHARTLVKMADMVTRSTEKVELKVGMDNYEESASNLLDGSDARNLDLEGVGGDAKDGANEENGNDGDVSASAGGGGGGGGGDASPVPRRQSKKSGKRGSGSSGTKKKESSKGDSASASAVEASTASSDDLNGDDADVSLRDQLTQTRRALLQVRENAKLKYRKLELEHKAVKKELKKAKDVIEKQTVEYKKLKVKLEGTKKERDDAREELSRELSGRGALASGISKENGRMIRRLREIRSECDNLEQERDELKQALERCTCEAGEAHEFTLASSLAHEMIPMNQASALASRHFVSESRRNIFESARSIRSNLSDEMEHEVEATKEEMARRRNGDNGSSVSFREPDRLGGLRSYLRPGEEKVAVDYDYDDDDDKSTISFISMSVRSLPATTKKAIDNVWSSTSMRLNNEIDLEHSGPGDRLTVEFKNKRQSRGKRSYQRQGEGHEDEAGGENIAPRGEPRSTTAPPSSSGKGFWASTSQRFLMGMAQEVDDS